MSKRMSLSLPSIKVPGYSSPREKKSMFSLDASVKFKLILSCEYPASPFLCPSFLELNQPFPFSYIYIYL